MLDSVGSSVLVWGPIVSMGAMFINLMVMVLELLLVNTVIPSVFFSIEDNCRFFIFKRMTCSPGRSTQNVIFDSNFKSFPIQKMVTSHFRSFRTDLRSHQRHQQEDAFRQQKGTFRQQHTETLSITPCSPNNPHS